MDVHYCKGEIETIQLFGPAECDMEMEVVKKVVEDDCCHKPKIEIVKSCHKGENAEQSQCCYNETIIIDVTDDSSQTELNNADFNQNSFVTYFILSSYFIFFGEEVDNNFKEYSPPLISKDISVMHQVFLI